MLYFIVFCFLFASFMWRAKMHDWCFAISDSNDSEHVMTLLVFFVVLYVASIMLVMEFGPSDDDLLDTKYKDRLVTVEDLAKARR